MPDMPSILDKIVAAKRVELADVERQAAEQPRPLSLSGALKGGGIRLIAEVKKTSPSTDVVEEDLDLKAVMVDGIFAKVHQHGAGAKKRLPA